MGVEGLENLTGNDTPTEAPKTERPTDAELEAKRQAELDADREEHNRRVGGGKYAQKHEEHRKEADNIS